MIRASRSSRSCGLVASATIAMTSLAGMMTKCSSRGMPSPTPPRPMMQLRSARSFMSIVRGQVMRRGSMSERVALLQMVVEHRREQRVRTRDRVEVAGEMEIDVVHRHDLRVAAARRAALHAEHRAEAWLANAQRDLLAHAPQRLREPDRHGALPFAGRRRVRRRDDDEPPARPAAARSRAGSSLCTSHTDRARHARVRARRRRPRWGASSRVARSRYRTERHEMLTDVVILMVIRCASRVDVRGLCRAAIRPASLPPLRAKRIASPVGRETAAISSTPQPRPSAPSRSSRGS